MLPTGQNFYCDKPLEKYNYGSGKPGKLREFFSPTLWPHCYGLTQSGYENKGGRHFPLSIEKVLYCSQKLYEESYE